MKGINLNKCQITLKISFQNFNVVLDNVSVHSITWCLWRKNVKSLTGQYNVFTCLSHDLIIAKSNAYEFILSSTRLIQSFLFNQKQKTKINKTYSSWEEILSGGPEGFGATFISISLYVILFSIMNNVNFASYTDDNTPYDIGDGVIQVIESPTICKRVGQKLNALSKVTRYNDLSKKCMFLNAFFFSQFSYCPLVWVWMFHRRGKTNKINRLHERCLRLIYSGKKSTFIDLFEKYSSVSIHTQDFRFLAIEMFQIKIGLSPCIMWRNGSTK